MESNQSAKPDGLHLLVGRELAKTKARSWVEFYMPEGVQAGTILMKEWPLMVRVLGLDSEPYSGNWSLVKALDGFALDRKVHAAGWNLFFMATEVRVTFFGALGAKKIQNALQRILGKVKGQSFNCLEVTGIVAKRFLGVPYTTVFAHSRHLQQSCQLDAIERRQAGQRDADWAKG